MENRPFYSKVLLFGEYSVIQHSMALCIPYPLFEGKLRFPREKNKTTDAELKAFCQYIKKMPEITSIDTKSFEFDLGQGLFFNSSIPQGFGVGSSGALVAAVYDRYAKEKISLTELSQLKDLFARLESHFHGSSSGVDPLISYLGRSLLIHGKKDYRAVELPKYGQGKGGLFLLNTGRPRRTEPLVNLFLEKCRQESFLRECMDRLIPINDACIDAFLHENVEELSHKMAQLSKLQFEHFVPMIPQLYQETWQRGLESGDFHLKLCGAGGGGFLLGITKDFARLEEVLPGHEIRPLFLF